MDMDAQKNQNYITALWDKSILPTLMEYIKIPNQSPQFDVNWAANGYMEKAVQLLANWCNANKIPGSTLDIVRLKGRTPVILIEVPGNSDETILLYGHLDKQPAMTGWEEGLSPWDPVLKGDKLYGRGAADDGYAIFASLAAIKSLHEQNIPHARCIILIEACEESGSLDLPFYIDQLKERIANPSLIICLDSGCGNYDQLWLTTSLRGLVGGILTIETLKEGLHSGFGSGVVPSCFRILRQLLNRVEDEKTGNIIIEALTTTIPTEKKRRSKASCKCIRQCFI